MMKRIAISLVCPLVGVLLMTSCLGGDDDTALSSEVALLSFGIEDLKSTKTIKKADGTDSTYTVVMSGSLINFTIDQAAHLVYNADSLAYQTNVQKVVVKVTASGGICYLDSDGTACSIEDTIDFTRPVTFRVTSYDEQFERDYKVSINVHQVDPKKTTWQQVKEAKFPSLDKQKAFVKDGRLFVIGVDGDGVYCTTSATVDDCSDWTTTVCSGIEGTGLSVLLMNETFYLKTDAGLYRSEDAISWAAVNESAEVDALPGGGIEQGVAWFCQPLKTNEYIQRTIFVATPEATDTCAQVWTKLSTEEKWNPVIPQGDNIYGCPNLENLAVIHYADHMYAFGGKSIGGRKESLEAFGACYESRDNGVTWKVNENAFGLSEEFLNRTESFSAATDGEYVWVMWSNSDDSKEFGEVWRGRWNGIK